MTTTPQDHRPPKPKPFSFKANGKTHKLPFVSEGKALMTGRDLRDATLGGDVGQLAYLIRVLEAADPSEDALDALYALPEAEMVDVLGDWAEYGDGDGASLGESSRSSS